ncbi:MAG: hypothetical protein ACSHX3_09460 [Litorimonas sp.]
MAANDRDGLDPAKGEPAKGDNWPHLIQSLYAQSDHNADRVPLQPLARQPLNKDEDFTLVDDVLDALMDPVQVEIARPVLRYALKEIARAALLNPVPDIIP